MASRKEKYMKKLLIMLAAGLMAAATFAAQCAGTTQEGKRCKREAAEGSKYCIGHAHQAKPSAQSKEKDDGHCWAVTAAGARCKNKKIGETDYCAVHAADKKPAKPVDQCCAMTWEGTRCTRKPDEGYRYCSQHRGQPVSAAKKAEPAKKPAKK